MFGRLEKFFKPIFLVLVLFATSGTNVSAQTGGADDYAFFLYNFARYSEVAVERDQFTFVIVGNEAVANNLRRIGQSKKIKGKTILVQEYDALDEIGTPQIVFVSSSEDDNLPKIFEMTKDKSVIVITEKSYKSNFDQCVNCETI
ncbi:YfiR family protein [Fulvivirgaceae bacterium BMA12]|uniref:YfiR family protein n=1 Tax=Agaribacillus aureus TaxID=3051825 RepID=A0ABT8L8Y9_9BACT|nr:YfiR family protein [Fulvivirgaceae bacterium BMA12]